MNYMDDLVGTNNNITVFHHNMLHHQQNYMAVSNHSASLASASDLAEDDPILSMSKRIIHVLQDEIALLWIIFGTIGNILSLMVLLRKKMRIHSTFTYLTLLALCDTFVLYFGLLRDYLVNNYNTHVYGHFVCKMHVFCFYFVLHMASWLLVAVNIDRLIAASFLSLSKKWCTPRTALTVSFYIAIGVLLVNSHFMYFTVGEEDPAEAVLLSTTTISSQVQLEHLTSKALSGNSDYVLHRHVVAAQTRTTSNPVPTTTVSSSNYSGAPEPINKYVYPKCLLRPNHPVYKEFFQNIFTWIDASAQVILPFIIMVICNVNIIHKVLLTKNKTNGKNLKRLRKIKGMCIMIVTVSIIFFVLEAPVLILICLIQGGWVSEAWPFLDLVWTIVNLMMYTNHVINFFTYAMAGTKFRRELLRLLCVNKIIKFLSQYKVLSLLNNQGGNSSPLHTAMPGGKPGGGGAAKSVANFPGTKPSFNSKQAQVPAANNDDIDPATRLITAQNINITSNNMADMERTVFVNESDIGSKVGEKQNMLFNKAAYKASRLFASAIDKRHSSMNINLEIDYNNNNNNNASSVVPQFNSQGKPVNLTSLIVNKKALIGESAVITAQQHRLSSARNEFSTAKKGRNASSDSSDTSSFTSSGSVEYKPNHHHRHHKKKSQDVSSLQQMGVGGALVNASKGKKHSKGDQNSTHSDCSETTKKRSYNLVKTLRKKSNNKPIELLPTAAVASSRHVNIVLPTMNNANDLGSENIRMNSIHAYSHHYNKDDLSDDGSNDFIDLYIR